MPPLKSIDKASLLTQDFMNPTVNCLLRSILNKSKFAIMGARKKKRTRLEYLGEYFHWHKDDWRIHVGNAPDLMTNRFGIAARKRFSAMGTIRGNHFCDGVTLLGRIQLPLSLLVVEISHHRSPRKLCPPRFLPLGFILEDDFCPDSSAEGSFEEFRELWASALRVPPCVRGAF
ncbi:MAG TPA: hypothetical protein DD473_06530 [Planctomycetaceae bacterium]|nr:hypothetical protein [Planctomycetaceae bacterium]